MIEKALGVLELQNKPVELPKTLAGPGTFSFPVKRLQVPGASARNVVDGDRSVRDAYIKCARQLEREGVAAIIGNCGFTALFQADVAAAVSIPVALSSLSLVPVVAKTLPPGRKVGILTYEARKLTEDHFVGAGWSSKDISVVVKGIEGSESWHELVKPVPKPVVPVLIKDVMTATTSLLQAEPDIGGLVFECTGFPIAADTVRRETRLRVADILTLANMLMEMSPPRGELASRI